MIERSVVIPRFQATLLVVLAGVALFLACVGSFAALAYLVRRRGREIAMRMALGATRGAVLRLVMVRALALAGAGLALGIAGSLAATRVLSAQLYGVAPDDPLTLGVATAILGVCALGAAAWPSLRATRVQPSQVLREE